MKSTLVWPMRALSALSFGASALFALAVLPALGALLSGFVEYDRTRRILEAQSENGPLTQQAEWETYNRAALLAGFGGAAVAVMSGLGALAALAVGAGTGGAAMVLNQSRSVER
jgi:hypothetical protein